MFKATEESISLHGLGFIQVNLQGYQRLHVWHPDLPKRSCAADSAIHDHRFAFESRVIVGRLRNETFDHAVYPRDSDYGTHLSYLHQDELTANGNRPWIPHKRIELFPHLEENVAAGDVYTLAPYVYHRSTAISLRAATILKKTWEGDRGAHSTCKIGVLPDADFDRYQLSADQLWAFVRDVLTVG